MSGSLQILRLNPSGTLDPTLALAFGSTTTGRGIALQSDGKVLVAVSGTFSRLYRVNADGSLDNGFQSPYLLDSISSSDTTSGIPISVGVRADGHILLGGNFTDVSGPDYSPLPHFGAALLNSDGTLDPTLSTPRLTGLESVPTTFARLSDRTTLVGFGVNFAPTDPSFPYRLGRLLADGAIDSSFTLTSQDANSILHDGFRATGLMPSGDGKFYVAGLTSTYGGRIGKFSANGVQDDTFHSNVWGDFRFTIPGTSGSLVLGSGDDPQAALYFTLDHMLNDGSRDGAFSLDPTVSSHQVFRSNNGYLDVLYVGSWPLAVQRDGKIIYHYFDDSLNTHLVRLDPSGSFDPTFPEITLPAHNLAFSYPYVYDLYTAGTVQPLDGPYTSAPNFLDALIEPDGRIILATEIQGPGSGLMRLLPDGSADPSFNIGAGAQWTNTAAMPEAYPNVEQVVRQSDDRLLITGTFEAFNGVPAPGIASLNPNGSVDTSFVAPAQRDRFATGKSNLKRQPDGSYLLSGPYSLPNESSAPSLIHILGAPAVANIATRIAVGTGDNVLIGGFIVTGNTPKKVVLRAIGPSLNVNGVPLAGRLTDPAIELRGNGVVLTNDNWRSTQEQEIIGTDLAPTDDHEAAIVAVLDPGAYTAIVRGANDTTGVGLVEVYDFGQPNALSGQNAQLANISTRGFVQTGDNVMIGGLIVIGAPTRVLVRAIGPDLANRG
ncbi:MAG: delta-60 repeat domain-containing protein, partial [Chthoniobacterales bacterium]